MKKLVILCFALCCVMPLMAQQNSIDKLFAQYSGQQGFKTVILGPKLIAQSVESNGNSSDMAKKIKKIRILTSEDATPTLIESAQKIADSTYDFISTTYENDEITSFYVKEVESDEKSFLMIAHRAGKEIIMEVYGDFNVTEISQLSKLGRKQK